MNKTILSALTYAILLISLTGCAALYRDLEAPGVELVSVTTPGISSDMKLNVQARMRITRASPLTVVLLKLPNPAV